MCMDSRTGAHVGGVRIGLARVTVAESVAARLISCSGSTAASTSTRAVLHRIWLPASARCALRTEQPSGRLPKRAPARPPCAACPWVHRTARQQDRKLREATVTPPSVTSRSIHRTWLTHDRRTRRSPLECPRYQCDRPAHLAHERTGLSCRGRRHRDLRSRGPWRWDPHGRRQSGWGRRDVDHRGHVRDGNPAHRGHRYDLRDRCRPVRQQSGWDLPAYDSRVGRGLMQRPDIRR